MLTISQEQFLCHCQMLLSFRYFDFAQNGLTGTVPQNLNFDNNRLRNGKDGVLNFLSFLVN